MTYIYLAVPWAPMGGGMFRVVDYLIQSQAPNAPAHAAQLRPLDTRGGGSAFYSAWILLIAMIKLVRGRLEGNLAGVHVNMAERLSVVRKGAIIALCRALGVPVVLHLHAAQLHQFYESLPPLLRWLTRWIFSLPAGVVVLGTASRRFVIEELKVPENRVHILNNGVPEPTESRDKAPEGSARRVLFVGNLSERKGVSDLLHALTRPILREGPPLEVTLAGGGDLATYQAKAQELGIGDLVRFEGWVDQNGVAHLMARADVLVLPSYDEGLPLVILEALANGVAVVCTPVGEIPSVLTDGVNACFVNPGDVDGIASALHRVMSKPALAATLGCNGRTLYAQEFSLSRFFANVARIHQRYFGVAALPADLTQEDATWPSAGTIRASGSPHSGATERSSRYIYLASPWSPVCGGIYKVVDYLFRSHTPRAGLYAAQLKPLETRGGGHAFLSLWYLSTALAKILFGQFQGGLAGVHVNIAERLSLVRKGIIVLVCRALRVPVVLHLHAQMRNFYLGLPAPLQVVTRWVFSLASGVVVIGPAARRFVTQELGVNPERVELVFNGVPEPTESRRKPEPGRVRQLLFLGRLGDAKGVSDLLQALTLPGFDRERLRLTIAGGGDVAGYQAKAQMLGVADMVHFAGLCNQEKVAQLLAQADVLVLPSYDEVLPLAILEALANGVAVVCTPVGELPSVLCGGVNALFVTPGDVRSLAEGLQQVLRDPELQDRLARNGRALYEEQFSMTRFFWGIARVHRRHFGLAAQPLDVRVRPTDAAPVRRPDEVRPT
jgi:glycosyltransferase involved in cell wall biosynthesis